VAKTYGRLTELNAGLVRLRRNVEDVRPDYEKIIDSSMMTTAEQGAAYMREHAPWRDDRGNRKDRVPGEARAGLHTETELEGSHKSIYFLHGVDYGIWLEISNHGKNQIIMPTVAKMGKSLMKSLRGTLSALRED
jgi:hypothetical protein